MVGAWRTGDIDLENKFKKKAMQQENSALIPSLYPSGPSFSFCPLPSLPPQPPPTPPPSLASSFFLFVPRFRKMCVRVTVPEGWAGRVWGPHSEG